MLVGSESDHHIILKGSIGFFHGDPFFNVDHLFFSFVMKPL